MASWFKRALEEAGDIAGDYFKNITKDPLGTVITGGIKPLVDTAGQEFDRYKTNNGGKQAEEMLKNSQAEADLEASQVLAKTTASESAMAAARYGGINGGLTSSGSTTKKKSILGGF